MSIRLSFGFSFVPWARALSGNRVPRPLAHAEGAGDRQSHLLNNLLEPETEELQLRKKQVSKFHTDVAVDPYGRTVLAYPELQG